MAYTNIKTMIRVDCSPISNLSLLSERIRQIEGFSEMFERWIVRYNEVVEFINNNHRNPSKYCIEEHDMLNWLKANRKARNAGVLKPERL